MRFKTSRQSYLIIAIWTLIKIVNVFQIHFWLKSIGIDRSVLQVVQAQGLIWLVGILGILTIFYFLENHSWFSKWTLKSVITNLFILAIFGLIVPLGPSVVYILWSDLSLNVPNLMDVYQNGTTDILKDVALYYLLLLSLSYGLFFYNEKKRNELKTAILKKDLTQAKLDLLHSQLQPHFLFNALHSISSLMEENVKDAQNILVNLSDLLRLSLAYQDAKFITLNQELEVLDLYLSIQMIRFSDSLVIEREIDEALKNEYMPPFLLQPLVENSFKHGMDTDLIITIKAKKVREVAYIEIEDNGFGFDQLEEGKGIKNVRTRLAALYGTNYILNISSSTSGVVNQLEIPLNLNE